VAPAAQPSAGGEHKAAAILAMIALSESVWVVWSAHFNPPRFLHYAGFDQAAAPALMGWASALLVVIGFVYLSRPRACGRPGRNVGIGANVTLP
jgi:hypothetical protein